MSSPKAPLGCWTESSQASARRIAGCSGGIPQASTAGTGPPGRPGSADGQLFAELPRARGLPTRVVSRTTGGTESEHCERRTPDRGLAGLGTKAIAVVHHEPLPAGEAAREGVVLEAVAER